VAKKGTIKVEITGLEDIEHKSLKLVREVNRVNSQGIVQEADNLVRVMRQKAPKDEHKLERAINKRIWKKKRNVVGVVVGVEGGHPEFRSKKGYYPASQEYGWEYPKGVFHPPHPYIRPTFDENQARIKIRLQDAYKQVIERAGR
jgi:HK97 gp10 family phage protein